ncbi:hypothetical protein HAX54_042979, partial [Datura stramonium]|nr:hypothetical protein [Datura stramonium]
DVFKDTSATTYSKSQAFAKAAVIRPAQSRWSKCVSVTNKTSVTTKSVFRKEITAAIKQSTNLAKILSYNSKILPPYIANLYMCA